MSCLPPREACALGTQSMAVQVGDRLLEAAAGLLTSSELAGPILMPIVERVWMTLDLRREVVQPYPDWYRHLPQGLIRGVAIPGYALHQPRRQRHL